MAKASSSVEKSYELQVITIGAERFCWPEVLFQPMMISRKHSWDYLQLYHEMRRWYQEGSIRQHCPEWWFDHVLYMAHIQEWMSRCWSGPCARGTVVTIVWISLHVFPLRIHVIFHKSFKPNHSFSINIHFTLPFIELFIQWFANLMNIRQYGLCDKSTL